MGQGQVEGKIEKKGDTIVVVRVDMDCEACKQKVRKVLKNFPGVENIDLDMDEQKVIIKGNVDAWKVYEALRKKCGRRTMLVHPQLSEEEKRKAKEDSIINSVNNIVDSITDLLTPKPPNTVMELKVRMHCGACAKKIKRILLRLDGVMEVEGDMTTDKVVVKGRDLDAGMLCERVKQSGKSCELISYKREEKAQEKKKGEKKEDKPEKKEEREQKGEGKEEMKLGKKKEGKKGENKGENKGEKEEGNKGGVKKGENKEKDKGEKKEDRENEKKDETSAILPKKTQEGENGSKKEKKSENNKETKNHANEGDQEALEVKKFMNTPYQSMPEYVYAPQIFSDENPNACCVM